MTSDTAGSTALITGASSGIGYELTKLFAADGVDVVMVARRADKLDSAAQQISSVYDVETTTIAADLTDPVAPEMVYEEVCDRGLVIDTLVNNAGFGLYESFASSDLETELDMIQLHVTATTILTKRFGREMLSRRRGNVLTTASLTGFAPLANSAVYSGTKQYQRAFMEAFAEEMRDQPITVTVLCPGATDTAFIERGAYDEGERPMAPATVAKAGYQGLLDGDRVVVPGLVNKVKLFSGRLLPRKYFVAAARHAVSE